MCLWKQNLDNGFIGVPFFELWGLQKRVPVWILFYFSFFTKRAPKRFQHGNQIQENIVPDNSAARAVPTIPGPNHDLTKKQIVDCPHTDRRYYAKGMCVNCYHRRGRTKKAWNCPHTKKTHYSKGLCKYCYLASYYKSRTTKRPAGYSDSNASFEVAS